MLLPVSTELWTAMKKALPQCGDDMSSCPGLYPTVACPQCHMGCRLGQELLTLPSYIHINEFIYRYVKTDKIAFSHYSVHIHTNLTNNDSSLFDTYQKAINKQVHCLSTHETSDATIKPCRRGASE